MRSPVCRGPLAWIGRAVDRGADAERVGHHRALGERLLAVAVREQRDVRRVDQRHCRSEPDELAVAEARADRDRHVGRLAGRRRLRVVGVEVAVDVGEADRAVAGEAQRRGDAGHERAAAAQHDGERAALQQRRDPVAHALAGRARPSGSRRCRRPGRAPRRRCAPAGRPRRARRAPRRSPARATRPGESSVPPGLPRLSMGTPTTTISLLLTRAGYPPAPVEPLAVGRSGASPRP